MKLGEIMTSEGNQAGQQLEEVREREKGGDGIDESTLTLTREFH